ncbi:MAG TPA: PrgI family protein, partial [Candidatus Saccharimonadales bacterium]
MATYKLIQDIEAEDKILGPLTLRQFIFALISVFLFYICFILITKHVAFMLVLFLPPALFCGFFAFPFGRDQPTEVWALAKLRFYFKPRRRVWNQSGVKELVTITVPKKVERVLTNGLSQTEVKSRLRALTDTIDSRGWATKNVDADSYAQPIVSGDSDRLIDIGNMPQEVPTTEIAPAEDILDETNNPIARQFETMIDRSTRNHRQQLIDQLNDIHQDGPA